MRAAIVLVAGALVASCQRSEDRAAEMIVEKVIAAKGRESDVQIDRDRGEIRVTLGGAVKPQGWPATVPIYPHAERAKIERNDGRAQQLVVATADSIHELRDYYREALPREGWLLANAPASDAPWSARRGDEDLQLSFADRGHGKGSRAEIAYRKRS